MNFSKCFKRNDYDNLDRFLIPQKFRNCRDPFEGDPFKIQSLKFRYADKPVFYPISDQSKDFGNSKHSQRQKFFYSQPSYQYCFEKASNVLSPNNLASKSIPELCIESVKDGGKKNCFNRSKSLMRQAISISSTKETNPSMQQTLLKRKIKRNSTRKNRSDLKSRLIAGNSGGCKITIKINGVPSNQVHINEQVDFCNSGQISTRTIQKPSPSEVKPSRSYVIHRDDTATDMTTDKRQSSRKLLRECSTHSMIPHKEQKGTIKGYRFFSSEAHSVGTSSSLILKDRSCNNAKINSSKKVSSLDNVSVKNPFLKNTSSGLNFELQASMLEKILSNNPIVGSSRKNFTLAKSKSALDQKFTSVPMSRKYTFERC